MSSCGYLVGAIAPVDVDAVASQGFDWGVPFATLLTSLLVVVFSSFVLRKRVNVHEDR